MQRWTRVFISRAPGITRDGFAYRPAASIPPRPRLGSPFARRRSCARRALWRSAPDFAVLPARLRHGRPLRTRSPCCSTKWSVDLPKRCLARRVFQRRLKTPSRPGTRSSQKPRSQRCGSCGRWFGPRGSPPKPFEELPAEVRAGLFSMFGASPAQALTMGGAVSRLRGARSAFGLHLTTPLEAGT